jgi:tRNA A37 threonylcarbamoyltransferase TsaD
MKKALQNWATQNELDFFTPKEKTHCTDNAAMIAAKGFLMIENGHKPSGEMLSPVPRMTMMPEKVK